MNSNDESQPNMTQNDSTADELRQRAAEIRWFHTIDLGHGLMTAGLDATPQKLLRVGMPATLRGKTVLDIGAWDGFFSFEAERRGAARVLATDHFCWSGPGWGTKAGFNFARETLRSKVEELEIDVMDLTPEAVGTFDVVFFFGVLYHLRHPLLALEKVAAVTNEMLLLETVVDLTALDRPAMAFYPGSESGGDGSNWCGPNESCVVAMLKDVGFKRAEVYSRTYEPNTTTDLGESLRLIRPDRAVFHASK